MLINKEIAAATLAVGGSIKDIINRGTGRTTVNVLRTIARAIECPGLVVAYHRHEGEPDTRSVAEHTALIINATVKNLGLNKIDVKVGHLKGGWSVEVTSTFAERLS